jgi:subtilisin family serine protease
MPAETTYGVEKKKQGDEAMKPRILWVLLVFVGLWSSPAAADNRFLVRAPSGLNPLQLICFLLGCNVGGGLDGTLGRVFLVTTPDLIDPNVFLQLLQSQPGIQHVEQDIQLRVMQAAAGTAPPSALTDNTPVDYFGVSVIHGYVSQPAINIVRLPDAQTAFSITGAGTTVAVIDTGVDPTHPVLQGILVPGYDFTRNIAGTASEMQDVNQTYTSSGASPAMVNQSSAAILDPQSVMNLHQPQYQAFGHGTMVSGIVHLVAPGARIMPLKAFGADGSGYLSDVLRAIYYAVQNGADADVINMSFSFPTYSYEVARAIKYATRQGVVCVASAGNDGKDEIVYPAALSGVMGVASTTQDSFNNDILSKFSNYGEDLVWVGAPGEGIVTTYPFGTYGAGWGTSFSAPFVSGAAALLPKVRPNCNEACAERALAHAVWISPDVGKGRIDLYQAVSAASQGPN